MRKLIHIILSFALITSSSQVSYAKKKSAKAPKFPKFSKTQAKLHLDDYLLPYESLAKLSRKQQAKYITFLFQFVYSIELYQARYGAFKEAPWMKFNKKKKSALFYQQIKEAYQQVIPTAEAAENTTLTEDEWVQLEENLKRAMNLRHPGPGPGVTITEEERTFFRQKIRDGLTILTIIRLMEERRRQRVIDQHRAQEDSRELEEAIQTVGTAEGSPDDLPTEVGYVERYAPNWALLDYFGIKGLSQEEIKLRDAAKLLREKTALEIQSIFQQAGHAPGFAAGPVEIASTEELNESYEQSRNYKENKATCIFGGHITSYSKKGDRWSCNRPEHAVNTEGCIQSDFGKKARAQNPDAILFQCNDFGFATSKDRWRCPTGIDDSCEVFEPICTTANSVKEVTLRCMYETIGWLRKNAPTLLHKETYDLFIEHAQTAVRNFEAVATGGGNITYTEYCSQPNLIKKRLGDKSKEDYQALECAQIGSLLQILKDKELLTKILEAKSVGNAKYQYKKRYEENLKNKSKESAK